MTHGNIQFLGKHLGDSLPERLSTVKASVPNSTVLEFITTILASFLGSEEGLLESGRVLTQYLELY